LIVNEHVALKELLATVREYPGVVVPALETEAFKAPVFTYRRKKYIDIILKQR
jgi:hypothetical protein